MPITPIIMAAINWVRGSTIGRYAAMAVGAIVAILTLRAIWRGQGARAAKQKLRVASMRAALERREVRDEVDRKSRRAGAAERLRNKWARD